MNKDIKIKIEKGDNMNFLDKIKEIKDLQKQKELEELFYTDETIAWFEYRKYIAIEIINENKDFFERLSNL